MDTTKSKSRCTKSNQYGNPGYDPDDSVLLTINSPVEDLETQIIII